jgi:hypothetical protein
VARSDFSDRCFCGRVGDSFALLLCKVDAPIPYVLTERGRREARKLRQWDVLFGPLDERRQRDAADKKARTTTVRRRRAPAAVRSVK